MTTIHLHFLSIVIILFLQSTYANPSSKLLVRFKSPTTQSSSMNVHGLSLAHPSIPSNNNNNLRSASAPITKTQVFKITDGKSVQEKIKELENLPDVDFVEPDQTVKIFDSPTDTDYALQWHHAKIGSPIAWDTISNVKQVKVCVIDSGLRIDHPDLAANVIKGWNVIPTTPGGPTPTPNDPDWLNYNDTLGHGTHVAGIIGALGNNARGVSGVTWKVGLMPCRFIRDEGAGDISDAILCMQLCRAEGAHIYSNSWGGVGFLQVLQAEIRDLQNANGLVVVAAGNDHGVNLDDNPSYPASYKEPNLMTVAATARNDAMAEFSNVGPKTVHVAAPGSNILSTTRDGDYGTLSGTSMATPVVSGIAALLQGMSLAAGQSALSPSKLKDLIMSTTDTMSGGYSMTISGGRVNVAKAVQALKTQLSPSIQWPPSQQTVSSPSTSVATVLPQVPATPRPPPYQADPALDPSFTPQCGASTLRGQPATQSSTQSNRIAENAVNGDCRNDPLRYPSACASTDPSQGNAWWASPLRTLSKVVAVSIVTRADCCWNSIGGAQILIGNQTWNNVTSKDSFIECGRVPATGIPRGQRLTMTCSRAMKASAVAVYLPKAKTSLTLCEVDVTIDWAASMGEESSISGGGGLSLRRRRRRDLM